jgi:hypothetical protein
VAAFCCCHVGAWCRYQSCVTEVLGLVLERVSGERYSDLLQSIIWSRLCCEEDADVQLDRVGAAIACGGVCATARYADVICHHDSHRSLARQGPSILVFFVVMQLLPHSMPTRHVITFNLLQSTMISTLMN